MEINLTIPQTQIFTCDKRFIVACCGRRFGKSYLAMVNSIQAAMSKPNATVWFVAPNYAQAKLIAWLPLKQLTRDIVVKKHETELWVQLSNGSRITLKGAQEEDSLRGASISYLVLDEYASMNPNVWSYVLRPACADQQAKVLFIGSPSGKNHFYDLWLNAEREEFKDQWASFQFTTLDGGNVLPEEIEAARKQMDERTFKQEFLATFQDSTGKIIYNFDRYLSVKDCSDRFGKLYVGIDFNVTPMTASIIQEAPFGEYEVIDEIYMNNSNTFEIANEIKSRYAGRQIICYPDPAGRQRKTSSAGKTDFTILEEAGFRCVAPHKHNAVKDGINNLNAAFLNTDGKRRLWIDPKCEHTIESLDRWCYKEGTSQPDKNSGFDHCVDNLRYAIDQLMPINSNKKTVMQIRSW